MLVLFIGEASQLPVAGADAITRDRDEALVHPCGDAARWSEGRADVKAKSLCL